MANIVKGSDTKILAASIKSPQEAADTLLAGADCLTVPMNILQQMTTQELSTKTVAEFNAQGIGLDF